MQRKKFYGDKPSNLFKYWNIVNDWKDLEAICERAMEINSYTAQDELAVVKAILSFIESVDTVRAFF